MTRYNDEPDLIGAAGYIFETPVRARRSRPADMDVAKAKAAKRRAGAIRRLIGAAVGGVVKRSPEVMVKVSGSAKGRKHLREHLSYITRNGKLMAEVGNTEAGAETSLLQGADDVRELATEWYARGGADRRRDARETINLVLSMPEGTDREALAKAASEFARARFGGQFDYVLVHHTDTNHPHAHLTIRTRNDRGQHLDPKKADLQTWREDFARRLRQHGVDAAATPRRARGVVVKGTRQPIHHLDKRRGSTRTRWQIQQAIRTLEQQRNGKSLEQPWRAAIVERQQKVRRAWGILASALERDGDVVLADQVRDFIASMPPVATKQDKLIQQIAKNPALLQSVAKSLEKDIVQEPRRRK